MTKTSSRPRLNVRKALAAVALVGAGFAPVAVFSASPASAAESVKGFENMPPA